ncbi:exodeoxyribonuclease V subunit gamma [Thiocapsa imhoffii]|uniref:RecBCD enzyme subunit RecC n=1 Tax=Thiocapsa imhoffii TaxID=382777 RepID=A0A9X0WMW9_9GAMM|nr:exodeoxyribonuclease V subunit gamma [Thiocapsa imhoffii]MBK1646777.1 exodeoxyribonuclease V subunit gamma [Thiocapsa imhoffii]
MDRHNDPENHWPTGFMLIQGNRLESLRGLLVGWLRRHPLGPLENEVVLVQSNGIGQWLKLALAAPPREDFDGGCGIAAAVDLMLPGRFQWRAYRTVLGDLPERSAYDRAPLSWRLHRLLGDLDGLAQAQNEATWLAPLRGFLATDGDARRRYQLAQRLADLYDQYQVYRADWLTDWQHGEDQLLRVDGTRIAVPDDQRWQPLLWRRIKQDLASAAIASNGDTDQPVGAVTELSRAEIHQRFLAQAEWRRTAQRPRGLPRRVIVFGLSSLPRQTMDVLGAIAAVSQVMLFVHNPSQHYWGDLVEGRELFRQTYRRMAARAVPAAATAVVAPADGRALAADDPSAPTSAPAASDLLHLHGHPLLAAWGKLGRDYIRLLDEFDERARYESHFTDQDLSIDLFESPGEQSLLAQLQDDILALRTLEERRERANRIDPERDRSIEFMVAHSPQREVEILHDQLLAAFAEADQAGQPLPPRDVLVMVPDIMAYAPHIEAVFARVPPGDPRRIPYHLADQGQRQRQPVLVALEQLLHLPQARLSVSELLDLLETAALRARFDLDESALPVLRRWIAGTNIRWGLDGAQRAGLGLPPGLEQNTWQFGLQRMLLGFATGDSGPWREVEPFAEMGGLEATLIGPLMQLLSALARTLRVLSTPRTPPDWANLIAELLDDFFRATDDADELILGQLRDRLEQWLDDCARGGSELEALPLEVVRESLLAGIDEPALSQRFLAGAVNFATLIPMRAIPFRQIWLLGMNDEDYPRRHRSADFDLMDQDYRPGDRSRREDDRYLFLEALLSAREKFAISWVGRSVRDNSERPPSVLVGQLRDHLAAGWQHATWPTPSDPTATDDRGRALVEALTIVHPLQPFSARYFAPNRAPHLFTYAHEWRTMHRPDSDLVESPPRLDPPTIEGPIELAALSRFLRHPVRRFYTERLALYLAAEREPNLDEEPFTVDALGGWSLRDAAISTLEQQLAATPELDWRAALQRISTRLGRAGHLPLSPFDTPYRETLREQLETPLEEYLRALAAYPVPLPTRDIRLETNTLRLEDRLSRLRTNGAGQHLVVRLQPSTLIKDDRVRWTQVVSHWPYHLAAQIEGFCTSCLIGPGGTVRLEPLERAQAVALLSVIMDASVEGLTALLPFACETGFAVLEAEAGNKKADPARTYEGQDRRDAASSRAECDDHPGYRRFWPSYEHLRADPRFMTLIDRLYRPLFEHLNSPPSL